MERCLERASEAVIKLSAALDDYANVQECLKNSKRIMAVKNGKKTSTTTNWVFCPQT